MSRGLLSSYAVSSPHGWISVARFVRRTSTRKQGHKLGPLTARRLICARSASGAVGGCAASRRPLIFFLFPLRRHMPPAVCGTPAPTRLERCGHPLGPALQRTSSPGCYGDRGSPAALLNISRICQPRVQAPGIFSPRSFYLLGWVDSFPAPRQAHRRALRVRRGGLAPCPTGAAYAPSEPPTAY